MAEWHPTRNQVRPEELLSQSNLKMWWHCTRGHEWEAAPNTRVKGNGCGYCSGRIAAPERSVAALRPDLAAQWHPELNGDLTAWTVMASSGRTIWWQCAAGHEWRASPANRLTRGCAGCSGRRAQPDTSLAALHPDVAATWHMERNAPRTPADVRPGSQIRVWWTCPVGPSHDHQLSTYAKLQHKNCAYCSGHLLAPERTLAAVHPHLAKEWHPTRNLPLSPSSIAAVSGKRVWWLCSAGHEWRTKVSARAYMQSNCPDCQPLRATSAAEIRLRHELATFLPVEDGPRELARSNGRAVVADVVCCDRRLVIEYDGHPSHAQRREADTRKTVLLQRLGWTVVRVRWEPHGTVGPHDVLIAPRSSMKQTVNALVLRLAELGHIPQDDATAYAAQRNGRARQPAEREIAARRAAAPAIAERRPAPTVSPAPDRTTERRPA